MGPYPDVFEDVALKNEREGFAALTEAEQVIYCVWRLEGEVNNGGFHQFFWNSASNYTVHTLSALEKIGAKKTKKLLMEAITVVFGDLPPEDLLQRRELLPEVSGIEFDRLCRLDRDFYQYEDDLAALVNKYLNNLDLQSA